MINKQARLSSLWAACIVMSTGRNDDLTNWNLSSKKFPQVFLLRNDKWCVGEGYFLLLWINIIEIIDKMHNPPKRAPVDFSGVSCGPLLLCALGKWLKMTGRLLQSEKCSKKTNQLLSSTFYLSSTSKPGTHCVIICSWHLDLLNS